MLTVKIQNNLPDGSKHTLIRECDRVYYNEGWYKQFDIDEVSMQFGEFINSQGASAQTEAWCVLVTIIKGDESSNILCLPNSWIYVLQDGKTVDMVKSLFIPEK